MRARAETVLLAVSFAALIALTASAQAPWYGRVLVGMEVGPTGAQFGHSDRDDGRYAVKFDGAEIVRRSKEAGAEYLVTWGRDGDYAYYDSDILPKAPGLGERDPLRKAVVGRLASLDNWVSLTGAGDLRGVADRIRPDWPFLVKGPATVYAPTTAETMGTLLDPHRTTRQREGREGTEWPMSADAPVGPRCCGTGWGRGRCPPSRPRRKSPPQVSTTLQRRAGCSPTRCGCCTRSRGSG